MAISLYTFSVLAGCGGGQELTEIATAVREPVSRSAPIVVFLPGTLASALADTETGERVYGREDALSVDPREPEGLRRLSLPLDPVPASTAAATDSVRPVDVLRRANERILFLPVSMGIYQEPIQGLRTAGLPETPPLAIPVQGPALTAFPYDWRRSVVDAAQALGAALEARGPDAAKVRLVGHSMGGVVALYYLMFGTAPLDSGAAPPPVTWAGARHAERAVLVAPPLRGAAVAVRNAVNGNRLAGPLVPVFPPSMLASHPSSFELMPRAESLPLVTPEGEPLHEALLSPRTWERFGWGLADPDEARNIAILTSGAPDGRQRALDRQAALIARARAFHRAVDRPVDPPEGLEIVVIAGTGSATPQSIAVPGGGGRVSVFATGDGDGTVLAESALAGFEDAADHPRKRAFRVEAAHATMLSDPAAFRLMTNALLK